MAWASIIEAHARIVTVLIWRHLSSGQADLDSARPNSRRLQVFRQLLEAHFRDRWTVADYASALGISPDRLHDLCRRALGKPPSLLIRERLIYEAKLLLERSTQSLDQIAAGLGFSDAPHFNKVFRAATGEPPGHYRKRRQDLAVVHEDPVERSYADWP